MPTALQITLVLFISAIIATTSSSAMAQTDLERSQNLTTCLKGRYPTLCKKHWLSPDEIKKVESAEHRENLQTCLAGRYPSLCRREKLSSAEAQQVVAAEKRENLKTCLTGRYKALCKKNLLSGTELSQVLVAEESENLRTCLTGRYPALCDKSLLTREQRSQVQIAEDREAETRKQHATQVPSPHSQGRSSLAPDAGPWEKYKTVPSARSQGRSSSGCESQHWIDSVLGDGQIIKLEDGSVWQVDAVDAIDSALWLPTTDIVACDDKLINTDDNESVSAIQIR